MAQRIKFSDLTLRALALPPAGERVEYVDTKVNGLRLRVSSTGVKTFVLLRRTKRGPLERLTIGRFDDIKCERARTEALKLIGQIATGANPAELKRANKGEPTFAALFSEYFERHSKPNKRSWRDDQQQYRDYLAQPLGRKKISKITRADGAAIHSSITRAGHPSTANRVKSLGSSMLTRAVAWGYLDRNPWQGIANNPQKSRKRFLKPGELPRVLVALDGEPNTTFRDYFLLGLLTGARRGNTVGMRWADVDLDRAEWVIPMTKSGEPQHVPLVPEAVEILKSRREAAADDATYVFPAARSDSTLGHMSGERKAWLRMLDRDEITQLRQRIEAAGGTTGSPENEYPAQTLARLRATARRIKVNTDGARLEDFRIHDLRRTMGSWQARTGASMIIIGKSLGHKSQQATAVYARLDLDPVRQAMETATTAMMRAGRGQPSANVVPHKKRG